MLATLCNDSKLVACLSNGGVSAGVKDGLSVERSGWLDVSEGKLLEKEAVCVVLWGTVIGRGNVASAAVKYVLNHHWEGVAKHNDGSASQSGDDERRSEKDDVDSNLFT